MQALDAATRSHPVIIDEVQKAPPLLDEVHWLVENEGAPRRTAAGMWILPWQQFLERLWDGGIVG